jgi:hypothetical protein
VTIEESKDNVLKVYPWIINEGTFQVIDAEHCLWIAIITTTFRRRELKEDELSFPILVCEHEVFAELSNENLRTLGEWCLQQENKA